MGLNPIYSEQYVASYANRVGAAGPNKWAYWYAISCLRTNRLIRPDIPEGPCARLHSAPSGAQQTFGIVGSFAGNDPEPISRAVIGGISAIGSFFSGLFSGAPSGQELQTQCAVVQRYNQFADAIESAIQTGQVTLQEAISQLHVVHDQLVSACHEVEGGTDSAPYGLRMALDALELFNIEEVYPAIQGPVAQLSSETLGTVSAALAGVGIHVSSSELLIGVIVVIVLILILWTVRE